MKILLPVDGSDYTKRMLGFVAAHDELLSAHNEWIVVHVVAPLPAYATRFLDRSTVEGYYREESERVLQPIRSFIAQKGWDAELVHKSGHAAEAIATLAKERHVDLVVMGSHGHTALAGAVLGSVASGVLARCHAPVLLVR